MIEIKLYKNGYEINGHASCCVCSEMSILAWAYANTINSDDKTCRYWTSVNDNPDNPNQGYTWMTFDPDNKPAKWMFEEYEFNVKRWVEGMNRTEVNIINIDEMLVK